MTGALDVDLVAWRNLIVASNDKYCAKQFQNHKEKYFYLKNRQPRPSIYSYFHVIRICYLIGYSILRKCLKAA